MLISWLKPSRELKFARNFASNFLSRNICEEVRYRILSQNLRLGLLMQSFFVSLYMTTLISWIFLLQPLVKLYLVDLSWIFCGLLFDALMNHSWISPPLLKIFSEIFFSSWMKPLVDLFASNFCWLHSLNQLMFCSVEFSRGIIGKWTGNFSSKVDHALPNGSLVLYEMDQL